MPLRPIVHRNQEKIVLEDADPPSVLAHRCIPVAAEGLVEESAEVVDLQLTCLILHRII